eukprot:COSAG06_NODE_1821_length_8290_cov_33.022586_8_plen_168_part_00
MMTQPPQRQRARTATLMGTRPRSTSSAGLRPHHRQSSPRSVILQHEETAAAVVLSRLPAGQAEEDSDFYHDKQAEHTCSNWLCCPFSCLVLSCLVLSCLVLSCLVLSCLVLSCRLHGLWLRLMHRVRHAPRLRCTRRWDPCEGCGSALLERRRVCGKENASFCAILY